MTDQEVLVEVLSELRGIRLRLERSSVVLRSSPTYLVDIRGKDWNAIKAAALAGVMVEEDGNRRAASRQLKIAKSTLLGMLRTYRLERVGLGVGTAFSAPKAIRLRRSKRRIR